MANIEGIKIFNLNDCPLKSEAEIKLFIKNYGTGSISHLTTRESTHEAANLHLDSQKAAELLSWHPKWNIDSCVTKTSDWYQEVSLGMDPYAKTIAQIEEYFS